MDTWIADGARFDLLLPALRAVIEDKSDLIVEHRFYRGARAPFRFVCSDYQGLVDYVGESASPGDSFVVWHFEDCCQDGNVAVTGKVPDASGRVPLGGAY